MRKIRESRISKIIAYYLIVTLLTEIIAPTTAYALTSGPTQPEFNSFTPIATSDMVDLASGDFNYNIPIMDVGGYPINLAYNSGVTMDQEASWVGLGWNLNVGEINRQVRGLPDDFRGDQMTYENRMRDNFTVGTNVTLSPAIFGTNFPFSLGLGVQYNNYEGVSWKPSIGLSFSLSENTTVGFNLSGSVTEGATLSPSLSISGKKNTKDNTTTQLSGSIGASFNSRQGLQNISLSASSKTSEKVTVKNQTTGLESSHKNEASGSVGGSISFNNTHNYTPTKRIAYINNNKTFGATIGGEVFGVEGEVRIAGYGSYQSIHPAYENRKVAAYGYENTHYKNGLEGVLDFNREKEQGTINKNTTSLPVTNYTYDTYSVEGQGVSGMFRPFRSQVTNVYNDDVTDFSNSGNFGVELGLGNLVHGGVDFKTSPTYSSTNRWEHDNYALPYYQESDKDKNDPIYESVAFRHVGELNVDNEESIYKNQLKESNAIRHNIGGGSLNRFLAPSMIVKKGIGTYSNAMGLSVIKRQGRFLRNQSIQKISANDAQFDKFVSLNKLLAQPHHTAGIKILKTDGTTYVFGKANYNTYKEETSFDVSGATGDNREGLVTYNGSVYGNHSGYSDKYVNRVITPAFAHSYSITSVLSSDYQDIDNNGPTDKDLGSYTKFDYTNIDNFEWRVPYGLNKASYNEGLKTSAKDQKGNYIYGIKQLSYLTKIETKTHVAFIDLKKRHDAMSVKGVNGGIGDKAMLYIESIRLYSKSELQRDTNGNLIDPKNSLNNIAPIKVAHFEYDYSLCPNIPSNDGETVMVGKDNINYNKGKLTLKKVYFTYRNSHMGKYTPYVFTYSDINPDYHMKANDVWGNYAPLKKSGPTNAEYPFVEQDGAVNKYVGAWLLNKVKLPSGGELQVHTESDDYKYVQNKKAMQMFKVVGAGKDEIPSSFSNTLYGSWGGHNKYIYVKIKNTEASADEIKKIVASLSEQIGKTTYFKFLLNMNTRYDYVSGYFEMQGNPSVFIKDNATYATIPLKLLDKEGGSSGNVNPIAKAGWGFGRTFLNRAVYSLDGSELTDDFESIVNDLIGSIGSMAEIFTGPNGKLEESGCARYFIPDHSWIRLENPTQAKLGGGIRVKKIELSDEWAVMNSIEPNSAYQKIYNEFYGQEYSYKLSDGVSSSGVATFEPNASPENPFVEPVYGLDGNYAERIGAPKELNYVEKPFCETFFPSPRVTYSRVSVANLNKDKDNEMMQLKRHATGKVVTEFYTSYDFPTIVNNTDLDLRADLTDNPVLEFLDVYSVNHITGTQGFSVETNDMNGKMRSQIVYPEASNTPISKVEYKYNVDSDNRLNNYFKTVNSKGAIENRLMGVDYDMINDFNESSSTSESFGVNTNLASFLVAIFPLFVPMPLPTYARHESRMRTATTTKHIHKTGVLVETIATDLGSRVSTKNLAWDAQTGQVLATQTINEFDDSYYTFNYPAYWAYENMGMASKNVNLEGELTGTSSFTLKGATTNSITKYFNIADELMMGDGTKLWVVGFNGDTSMRLIDKEGKEIKTTPSNLKFKVVRSGNKNQQMASMASVTSMINPVSGNQLVSFYYPSGSMDTTDKKVINASAIEYSNVWESQCENDLPDQERHFEGKAEKIVNPFLYNILGNWRPIRSYAYLTGRNNYITANRRKAGYFVGFNPFYKIENGNWIIDKSGWTYASEVTQYSPYGVELENKDALNRYSAAQYGYQYKLPTAVSSNSKYNEMGFDGFEDYTEFSDFLKPHFGFSQNLKANSANYELSNQKSHTGHNSIAVKPGKSASFVRKIGGCKK